MAKVLAFLTIVALAMPAVIVSLWWTALCTQFLHRVPSGDSWETTLNLRRVVTATIFLLIVAGWIAVFAGWIRLVTDNVDSLGIRQIVDWAVATATQ